MVEQIGGDPNRGLEGNSPLVNKGEGKPLITREGGFGPPERRTRDMQALLALGLTGYVFDGAAADPLKDARSRFREGAEGLVKSGDLTAVEAAALKKMGDNFIGGNWPGFAQAIRELGDSADKVLPQFKKLVEANTNDKPNDPKQLRVTIVPDERGAKIAFDGERVNGGKGQLLISSQDNSVKFVSTTGKPLDLSREETQQAVSDFKDYVRDRFAAIPAPKEADKPAAPEAKKEDPKETKECREAFEKLVKDKFKGNDAAQKAALELFDYYKGQGGYPNMFKGIQDKFNAATDPAVAEKERNNSLAELFNRVWLPAAALAAKNISPDLDKTDPLAKLAGIVKTLRGKELPVTDIPKPADKPKDGFSVFGVKTSDADVPKIFSKLLTKGVDNLNADEQAELKACQLGMGPKPFYKDLYDAYKEGMRKGVDLDELGKKLWAYREAREKPDWKETDKDYLQTIEDIKKLLKK
jgi:hypothetical protein